MYFVVRPDVDEEIDLLVLISSSSFNAESFTAGRNLSSRPDRATRVSFYRTMDKVRHWRWLPLLSWMAQERPLKSQRVGYITDSDLESERYLNSPHALVVLAPSEYWTRGARVSFDRFVARGGNAIIYSGGSMTWQVRYAGEGNSMLTSFRDSEEQDPMRGTPLATLNWRDKRLDYPVIKSIGGDYFHGGYPEYRRDQGLGQGGYWVYAADHPVFRDTGLKRCESIMFYKNMLYDGMPVTGLDAQGFPVPDVAAIGAHAFNLLAFDWSYRHGHTIATMHIFKPAQDSGFVFNLGAQVFARNFYKQELPVYAKAASDLKQIFINLVNASANGENRVQENQDKRKTVFPMTTPHETSLSLEQVNFECQDYTSQES